MYGVNGWKVKPIWILLEQETVSGSGICWAICKSAPRSRQTTTQVPHHSVFYRPDALPAAQPQRQSHSNKIQPVSLSKMSIWSLTYWKSSDIDSRVTNISKSFTYKMAAKTSWHRYGTKLRHCRLMYTIGHEMRSCVQMLNLQHGTNN